MIETLRDLVAHKGYANAALFRAIRNTPAAAADPALLALLHHILLANRFWLLSMLEQPFVLEDESRPASSVEALARRYAEMQSLEAAWLGAAAPADLERPLTGPLIPGGVCTVAQALLQVCLHSHGHRAQAAKMLRAQGGTPPATDFILWLTTRPPAEWGEAFDAP
jgi:uncharacterized damage-inducible protein DinB